MRSPGGSVEAPVSSRPELDVAPRPEVRELASAAQAFLAQWGKFKILTAADYSVAGNLLQRIKARLKELEEKRREITVPMDMAKKRVLAMFRVPESDYAQAELHIKRAMVAFTTAQEAARRAEQARLDAEARKRADALRERAAKAAEAGKDARAAALDAQAAAVVAPVLVNPTPKVSGVQLREVWKFAIEDAAALPREYTMPDEPKLRRVVQALKAETRIPGVRVWSEKTVAAGATTEEG